MNQMDLALEAFEFVVDANPDYPGAFHNLSNVYYIEKQFAQAADGYMRAAEKTSSARSWYAAAGAFAELGKPDSALWALDQSIEIDSLNADARRFRADLRFQSGMSEGALLDARSAVGLAQEDIDIILAWARIETQVGNVDDVLFPLQVLTVEKPWNYSVPFELARAYQKQGNERQATRWFSVSDRAREFLQPTELLERRVAAQPGDVALRIELGDLYREQRRLDLAAEQYSVVVYERPDNLDAAAMLGTLYAQSGRNLAALDQFRRVLQADPNHELALANLAVLLLQQGQPSEAQQVIDELRRINPEHPAVAQIEAAIASAAASTTG